MMRLWIITKLVPWMIVIEFYSNYIPSVYGYTPPSFPLLSQHHQQVRLQQRQQQQQISRNGICLDSSSNSNNLPVKEETQKSNEDKQIPDMVAYSKGYRTVYEEIPYKSCQQDVIGSTTTSGTVPDDLLGTYFRAGPAMFSAGSIVPPKTSIVQPKQPPVPDGQDLDRLVRHPFEGDGAVLGVTFSPPPPTNDEDDKAATTIPTTDGSVNEVSVRYRFVRTIGFTAERKKGARTYRGMDTTRAVLSPVGNDLPLPLFRHHLLPGLNKLRKNTSNTRTVYWGQRLFSMWEGGLPYKLDGRACDTEGKSRFGGAIKKDDDPLGSKMAYDADSNRVVFYGVQHTPSSTGITLYEFDESFKLVPNNGRQSFDIPGFALVTDFTVTKQYTIFIQPDITVKNSIEYMMNKDPGKVLAINNGPGLIHLFPRASSKQTYKKITIPVDDWSEANVQFCNAYEEQDGKIIVVDLIRSKLSTSSQQQSTSATSWPWGTTLSDYQSIATEKSLWRYTIDTKAGGSGKVINKQQLSNNKQCTFGVINPQFSGKPHRFVYMNIGSLGSDSVAPPQGITKLDTQTLQKDSWLPQPYEFCGEPMYAPRTIKTDSGTELATGEDTGYILSLLFNGQKEESEILIFDAAQSLAAGPISRIPLGIAIPHGYHGCFATGTTWTGDEIQRRAKLADKIESKGNRWNEVKSDFSGLGLRFDDMEEYFGDFFS